MNVIAITLERRERLRQQALKTVYMLSERQAEITAEEFTDAIRQMSRGGYLLEQIADASGRKDNGVTAHGWLRGEAIPETGRLEEMRGIYNFMRYRDALGHRLLAKLG